MKKVILSSLVISGLAFAAQIQIQEGWQLLGTGDSVVNISAFNKPSIQTVWTFDKYTQKWRAYSPNPAIQAIINDNNQSITSLTSIGSNEGFWVNVNQGFSDILDTNNTIPTSRYVDPLFNVTLSNVAGKTFKYIVNAMQQTMSNSTNLEYETITFDSSGVATKVIAHNICDYNYDANKTSTTLTVKVENDNLNFYVDNNTSIAKSYKILASDDSGVVFGQVYASDYGYDTSLPADIFYALNESVSPTPMDMSTKVPFALYDIWSSSYYYTFESNGTIISHNVYDNIDYPSIQGEYSISNGAIVQTYTNSNSSSNGYSSIHSIQSIHTIGRYDITNQKYEGSQWNSTVTYYDTNNTSMTLNLTENNAIDTWQEIFVATGYKIYDTQYYDNNNTTNYGGMYTISTDGKTLTTSYHDGCSSNSKTIINSTIVSSYGQNWVDLTSSSPIVNDTYTTAIAMDRVLNKKTSHSLEDVQNDIKSRISKSSWVK